MRRRNKVILGGTGLLATGVVGLVLLPSLLSGPLVQKAVRIVSRSLDTEVVVTSADVSLLRRFPRVSVQLDGVTVAGSAPFQDEPFASAERIQVAFDILDVIRGNYVAREIVLDKPMVHAIAGADETTNYAFGRNDAEEKAPTAESGDVSLQIEDLHIRGMTIRWDDRAGGLSVRVDDVDLDGNGSVDGETIAFKTSTQVADLTVKGDGDTWIHQLTLAATGDLEYGLVDGHIALRDFEGRLNELPVAVDANITPQGDQFLVKANLTAPEATVGGLISLIPPSYRGAIADMKTTGEVALAFTVDGLVDAEKEDYPALTGQITVKDGTYQTAGLPSTVQGLNLQATIDHPQGPLEPTVLDIKDARFRVDASVFQARANLKDLLGDPLIDLDVDANLDLASLVKAMPIEGTSGQGTLALDLSLQGRQSALSAPEKGGLAVSGTLVTQNLMLNTDLVPAPVKVARASVAFTPEHAEVSDLSMSFGKSDVAGTGRFDNLLGYALGGGVLSGRLDIQSKTLDLTPFMADPATPASEPAPASPPAGVLQFPPELDLRVGLAVATLTMDPMAFSDLAGQVHLDKGVLRIDGLGLGVAGGRATVNGTYSAPSSQRADVDVRLRLDALDVVKTLDTFPTLKRVVPDSLGVTGGYGADLSLATGLDASMAMIPESLASNGALRLNGLTARPDILGQAASKLGRNDLKVVKMGSGEMRYAVKDGKLGIEPTPVSLGPVSTVLSGRVGVIDQALSMLLETELPTAGIPSGLLSNLGVAVPDKVPVGIKIGGTITAPTLSVDASAPADMVKKELRALAADAISQAVDLSDGWLDEAKKRADEVIKKAEAASARIRREGKAQGAKLVAEANNPLAKAAAKKGAEQITKQSDKAADKVLKEAQKQAENIIESARKSRDAQLKKAK